MSMNDPRRLRRIQELREAEQYFRFCGGPWRIAAAVFGWWRRHILLDKEAA